MSLLNELAEENKLLRKQRDALLTTVFELHEALAELKQPAGLDKPQPLEHTGPQYDARPSNPPAP